MKQLKTRLQYLLLLLVVFLPANAISCPVCFGAKGDPVNEAMGSAILLLLGFIGCVLVGVSGFFLRLFLKEKNPQSAEGLGTQEIDFWEMEERKEREKKEENKENK